MNLYIDFRNVTLDLDIQKKDLSAVSFCDRVSMVTFKLEKTLINKSEENYQRNW